jgi:uncharacterized protein
MFANRLARWAATAFLPLAVMVYMGAARTEAQQAPPLPSPAALLLAKQLVSLKKAQFAIWDSVVPGVIEQAKNALLQTNPALSKELDTVAQKLRQEFAPRSTELFDIVANLYAQQFTEKELSEIVAFYRSPIGGKLLAKEPTVNDQSLGLVQQWAAKFSEEVIVRMRAEMKKKGYDL